MLGNAQHFVMLGNAQLLVILANGSVIAGYTYLQGISNVSRRSTRESGAAVSALPLADARAAALAKTSPENL